MPPKIPKPQSMKSGMRNVLRYSDSASLWNCTLSPGWTSDESETLRKAVMKFGVGDWKAIFESNCLPGKTNAQMNLQLQRLLGQQSTSEFAGIHVDPLVIGAINSKIQGPEIKRKNNTIVNTGGKLSKEELAYRRRRNTEQFGIPEEVYSKIELVQPKVEEPEPVEKKKIVKKKTIKDMIMTGDKATKKKKKSTKDSADKDGTIKKKKKKSTKETSGEDGAIKKKKKKKSTTDAATKDATTVKKKKKSTKDTATKDAVKKTKTTKDAALTKKKAINKDTTMKDAVTKKRKLKDGDAKKKSAKPTTTKKRKLKDGNTKTKAAKDQATMRRNLNKLMQDKPKAKAKVITNKAEIKAKTTEIKMIQEKLTSIKMKIDAMVVQDPKRVAKIKALVKTAMAASKKRLGAPRRIQRAKSFKVKTRSALPARSRLSATSSTKPYKPSPLSKTVTNARPSKKIRLA
ncbi:hypothetical protein [Absidia glauca]|uniref:Myb-like domain-containing protein n=1 Tax=Absidia glauca TaxID=4829 RepID=A0A163MNE6_ABSGL|nr:hypothetical protein [Absidia glauca]